MRATAIPIFEFECGKCQAKAEEIRQLSDLANPPPWHCGVPMARIVSRCGMALVTKGGNWTNVTPAAGRVQKGNRKPKTIGRGHGIGGRRKNPTIVREGGDTYSVETKR